MRYMYLTFNNITYFVTSNGIARIVNDPVFSLKRSSDGEWRDNEGAPAATGLTIQLEVAYKDLQ